MEFYEIPLVPKSAFGTPLKGDTLFGHFCWQAVHNPSLLEGGLDAQLSRYPEEPFLIFSSAFPRLNKGRQGWAVKRPDLPLHFLESGRGSRREQMQAEKELKKKQWIRLNIWGGLSLYQAEYLPDSEVFENYNGSSSPRLTVGQENEGFSLSVIRAHNTINRLTGTTGEAPFTPYASEVIVYPPGLELAVFALLDTKATSIERVVEGLSNIGRFGFGRDASTGLGRFAVGEPRPLPDPGLADAGALYTLAPSVPAPSEFENIWFAPFVRLGKHGDRYALSGNPFKNPVVMADEGAVLVTTRGSTWNERPYVGRSIHNVSLSDTKTVVQGYSPVIPLAMEH